MKWRWMYRLMDKPPGDGGDPGSGGDPPTDPPADGDLPADSTVPVDVLPEELRDRPAAQQKFILEQMVNSLSTRNAQVQTLTEQVAELRGAISAVPVKPAEPDPHEGKPLEELILEDSEAALDRYMEKRGYVKAFDDLTGRVDSAEFTMIRAEIDDFGAYEEDVKKILKEGNLAHTRGNVQGAYTMAVGQRALMEKAARQRSDSSSLPPSSPALPSDTDGDVKWKSDLEKEIAAAHNVTDPKEWYGAGADAPMALKLPT